MSRVFVTGSTTGLGRLAGERLVALGQEVIFHARTAEKADALRNELGGEIKVVVGDISVLPGMFAVAEAVNALGPVDAIIQNAGAGYGNGIERTTDDFPTIFAVNVLAPHVLTAKIPAKRLVFLSSSMHQVSAHLDDALWNQRPWRGAQAYSESKLYVTALALAFARLRPEVFSNAVDPGWVPTRMGGAGAPDDLHAGAATQVALAIGEPASVSRLNGEYLHHMKVYPPNSSARDVSLQDKLLALCQRVTGVILQ